jgi:AraC-like DNA-binding protein
VSDLSPWDASAVEHLEQRSARIPVLLYLPPTGVAFAALANLSDLSEVRLQVQSRDGESLRHLRDTAAALVRAIPHEHVMGVLAAAMPGISSVAWLFGHRALRVLGSGRRPTVRALARALGFSPRTLQRRLAVDGLPSPKVFLDWLTLAHVRAVAASGQLTMARAAARAGLTSNDLYRIRKRVRRECEDERRLLAPERLVVKPEPVRGRPAGAGE